MCLQSVYRDGYVINQKPKLVTWVFCFFCFWVCSCVCFFAFSILHQGRSIYFSALPFWIFFFCYDYKNINQIITGFPLFSVMGNASGRKDGEGPSEVDNFQGDDGYVEPMAHSPPLSPRAFHPSLFFTSQVSSFLCFSIFFFKNIMCVCFCFVDRREVRRRVSQKGISLTCLFGLIIVIWQEDCKGVKVVCFSSVQFYQFMKEMWHHVIVLSYGEFLCAVLSPDNHFFDYSSNGVSLIVKR